MSWSVCDRGGHRTAAGVGAREPGSRGRRSHRPGAAHRSPMPPVHCRTARDPTHPVGSFPHIPYYAIGCTLDAIKAESRDGRMKVEVFGRSALGRADVPRHDQPARDEGSARGFKNWEKVREQALDDPDKALKTLRKVRDDVKVPIFIQSAIHGNEYEGVDADDAAHRPARDDALRHGSGSRRDPRPHDPGVQRRPEPRRPCRRDARQRQRLRPQPRLPDAVAAGGAGLRVGDAEVAVPGHARPARLRDADADRGDDQAA